MKHVLLATTALIAGMIVSTQGAGAQTAGPKAPFTALLDGDVNSNLGIQSGTQNTAHARQFGLQQDASLKGATVRGTAAPPAW